MPPVPIDEPLGYRRGRRVSYNEAVGTAPIPHGHAIVNSPPPNHHRNPKTKACVTAVRTHRRPSSWRGMFSPVGFILTPPGAKPAGVPFFHPPRTAGERNPEGQTAPHRPPPPPPRVP